MAAQRIHRAQQAGLQARHIGAIGLARRHGARPPVIRHAETVGGEQIQQGRGFGKLVAQGLLGCGAPPGSHLVAGPVVATIGPELQPHAGQNLNGGVAGPIGFGVHIQDRSPGRYQRAYCGLQSGAGRQIAAHHQKVHRGGTSRGRDEVTTDGADRNSGLGHAGSTLTGVDTGKGHVQGGGQRLCGIATHQPRQQSPECGAIGLQLIVVELGQHLHAVSRAATALRHTDAGQGIALVPHDQGLCHGGVARLNPIAPLAGVVLGRHALVEAAGTGRLCQGNLLLGVLGVLGQQLGVTQAGGVSAGQRPGYGGVGSGGRNRGHRVRCATTGAITRTTPAATASSE